MVGVAGEEALVAGAVNGAREAATLGHAWSQHFYLGGLKSAQCYGGVEGRCWACGVYRYLSIAVGALYGASCAFSFSTLQGTIRVVLRTPG